MEERMKVTQDIGIDIYKGEIRKGVKFFAWDAVQDCSKNNCPAFKKCEFLKKGKCAVQVKYLKTLTETIQRNYKYLDEMQLFKVGMQIIPLYSHLLRLKLVEMGIEEVIYMNNKGGKFVHPVYKEIRQTLLTITMMWKDLEITPHIPDPEMGNSGEEEVDYLNGDSSYADNLVKEGSTVAVRGKKVR